MTCEVRYCAICGEPVRHAPILRHWRFEGLQPDTIRVWEYLLAEGPTGGTALRRQLADIVGRSAGYHLEKLVRRGLAEKIRPDPAADRLYRAVEP